MMLTPTTTLMDVETPNMSYNQEKINFTTERMLAMYAAGVQVADIADDFETSYNAVYDKKGPPIIPTGSSR